jgi:hypothetical protein
MEIAEILEQFQRSDGPFPRAAVTEAITRREEITPELLRILDEVVQDPDRFATDDGYMAHVYAMYLVAQFRERRAYSLLIDIFSAPGELVFDLAGDVVTMDLGRILASVSGGDLAGMKTLIENENANEYARTAGLRGLLTLVATGALSRGEVVAYFGELFGKLDRKPSHVWSALVCCCADLCPVEVRQGIRQAYDDGLVDSTVVRWEEIDRAIDLETEIALERLRSRLHLVQDIEKEMGWFSCFQKRARLPESPDERIGDGSDEWLGLPAPIRRTQPKIGRNEPCPCGSGKKYKRCCGR